MKNYYAILELPYDANQKEIRKQYLKLSKKHHPDFNNNPNSTENMQKLNEAYDVLSDSKKKYTYDKKINIDKLKEEEKEKGMTNRKKMILTKNGYFRK